MTEEEKKTTYKRTETATDIVYEMDEFDEELFDKLRKIIENEDSYKHKPASIRYTAANGERRDITFVYPENMTKEDLFKDDFPDINVFISDGKEEGAASQQITREQFTDIVAAHPEEIYYKVLQAMNPNANLEAPKAFANVMNIVRRSGLDETFMVGGKEVCLDTMEEPDGRTVPFCVVDHKIIPADKFIEFIDTVGPRDFQHAFYEHVNGKDLDKDTAKTLGKCEKNLLDSGVKTTNFFIMNDRYTAKVGKDGNIYWSKKMMDTSEFHSNGPVPYNRGRIGRLVKVNPKEFTKRFNKGLEYAKAQALLRGMFSQVKGLGEDVTFNLRRGWSVYEVTISEHNGEFNAYVKGKNGPLTNKELQKVLNLQSEEGRENVKNAFEKALDEALAIKKTKENINDIPKENPVHTDKLKTEIKDSEESTKQEEKDEKNPESKKKEEIR